MIGMAAKEAEEKITNNEQKNRHKIRFEFWEQALNKLEESSCGLYSNINPSNKQWLSAGSGVSSITYALLFGTKEIGVRLIMWRKEAQVNTFILEELKKNKDRIEQIFGDTLLWESSPDRIQCRVAYRKNVDGYNKQEWPKYIKWLVEHIIKLENALHEPLLEVSKLLKQNVHKDS